MKTGTITTSTEKPSTGFYCRKEGCSTYIQYIEDVKTIEVLDIVTDDAGNETEVKNNGYKFTLYYDISIIKTYDELINLMVKMKYSIEEELAMINKLMANPDDREEYDKYRRYVEECKATAKLEYKKLNLIK